MSLKDQSSLSLYIEELDRFAFVNATPGTQPSYRIIGPKTQDVFSNKTIRSVDNDVEASSLCQQGTYNKQTIKNSPSGPGQCLYSLENNTLEWRENKLQSQVDELIRTVEELKAALAIANNKINELAKGTEVIDTDEEITGTGMSNTEAKSIIEDMEPIIDINGDVHISGNLSRNIGAIAVVLGSLQRK